MYIAFLTSRRRTSTIQSTRLKKMAIKSGKIFILRNSRCIYGIYKNTQSQHSLETVPSLLFAIASKRSERGNLYTISTARDCFGRFTPSQRQNDTASWEDFWGSYSARTSSANF
jgi:hypothetical protein